MTQNFTIGVDYGTNSARALLVDAATGEEIAIAVYDYKRGEAGVILDPKDPHLARQHPADYQDGFIATVSQVMRESKVDPAQVVGIGVDTTGSTPLPIDANGTPLALLPQFADNPHAMAWLWKDHTGAEEAREITEKSREGGYPYLAKIGGMYSSEWFWAKILKCRRVAPDVFAAASSWTELQDYVPGWLVGKSKPDALPRGVCAAGHKALFHREWGGLPSKQFLAELHPDLAPLRDRLYEDVSDVEHAAGGLTAEIAAKVGLNPGTLVAVGAFDAHLGAIGSGVRPGTLVKIMGTSTCDIMVGPADTPDIPGVCGVVPGSVIPGQIGIEAGQSAVGDLFNWWAARVANQSHEALTAETARLRPGESGLLALDWNNGNRTILVDQLLSGLIIGQTLATTAGDIYRTMIEATAFGSRVIIEQIEKFGVPIHEIVICGGIAEKSPLAMQIYADVFNRPVKVSRSSQTCALGSAIAASVVAGVHLNILAGIEAMTGHKPNPFMPEPGAAETYNRLYALYRTLHDAFGETGVHPDVSHIMKDLIQIQKEALR